jgi:hypothetical protein
MNHFRLQALFGHTMLRQTAEATTAITGIRLEHDERPRFDAYNGKSDQPSVNETKPALFSSTGNEHVAVDADTERFAMMMARPPARGPNSTRRSALLARTRDKAAAVAAVSRRGKHPRLRLALCSQVSCSRSTQQRKFISSTSK